MTTISFKEGQLAADSQVSLGNLISNNDFNKVQRFDSNEFGSVYIGAAGTLSHILEAFEFIDQLFSGEQPDAIKFGSDQFNMVMLTEDGKLKEGILTEASTNIMWVDCEEPWAIGSGSQIAIGAMSAGKTAEEAVKIAAQHDCYTNDNVKVYNASELSYTNLLKAQRDAIDEQIKMIEEESGEGSEESEGTLTIDIKGSDGGPIEMSQEDVRKFTKELSEALQTGSLSVNEPVENTLDVSTPLSRGEIGIDADLLEKLKQKHCVEEEPSTIPFEVLVEPPEQSFEEVVDVVGKEKTDPVKGVVERAKVGIKYDWESDVDEMPSNLREGDEVRVYFREGDQETDDSPQTWDWESVGHQYDIVAYELITPVEDMSEDVSGDF